MRKIKAFIAMIKKPENRKKFFWYWIGYQALKGSITATFIWAPVIYASFHH